MKCGIPQIIDFHNFTIRIIIIAEGEPTRKVLVGFMNNLAISGLRHSLNMLLDEGVDALANLDGVSMVAKMNARTLSGVIVIYVEDFGVA